MTYQLNSNPELDEEIFVTFHEPSSTSLGLYHGAQAFDNGRHDRLYRREVG